MSDGELRTLLKTAGSRSSPVTFHTVELSSSKQAKLTRATDTNQRTVGTARSSNRPADNRWR